MYVGFLFVTLYAAKRELSHEKGKMHCTKLQAKKGYINSANLRSGSLTRAIMNIKRSTP
jgi:hypothetical protein